MSEGLLLPHIQPLSDESESVGGGHCYEEHNNRLADTSTNGENTELVTLLLLCPS